MRQKVKQGDYEYFNKKRQKETIKTLIYFGISLSLFVAGYAATKTKANLLTIVAVLGLLPASKSCVCSPADYEFLKDTLEHFKHAYGLVFTSYKTTYEVAGCIVKNGYIYGFLTNHKDMGKDLEEHIGGIVKQNGYQATIGMFSDKEDFLNRLKQLQDKKTENEENDEKLMVLLHQISL